MHIDRRITNGLAWAGVVLVVGVPVADVVSAQLMGERAADRTAQIAVVDSATPAKAVAEVAKPVAPVPAQASARPASPVAPAAAPIDKVAAPAETVAVAAAEPVAPAVKVAPAAASGDVVDNYLKSGKALPSYITGGGATQPAVQANAPVAPVDNVTAPAVGIDPVSVAAVDPAKTAPMPMPLSMRPEPVVVIDTPVRASQNIEVGPSVVSGSSATVSYDELQDWESGPLSEFLAKRQSGGRVDPDYDPDGFFLDEGPNAPPRRDRLIGPADGFFLPFGN